MIIKNIGFACVRVFVCMKSTLYTIVRSICTIVTIKNLRKTRLKDSHTTLSQTVYAIALINKGFEVAEKMPLKTSKPQKRSNEEPLANVSNWSKKPSELFSEIRKKPRTT